MIRPEQGSNFNLSDVINRLVHRHGEKWKKFVLQIVRNGADAEDVLQEAVRRVLSRKPDVRSDEEVRMYLGRAIGNTAIELYHTRKRERRRRLPLREQAVLYSESSNPQDLLEAKESSAERKKILALLAQGLRQLPAKQYEAVRLTVMDSSTTSIRDAGTENGIPYSTLRHRSVQGLRRLRRFLRRATRSTSGCLVIP